MPKTQKNMFEFWIFLMIEGRLTLWPMAYGQLQEWESVASGTYWEVWGFPRSVACFVSASTNGCNLLRSEMEVRERVQTASICCDLLLHCCTGSIPSICIRPEETERLWREASDRKRRRERGNQRRNCSRSWSTLTEDCTILSNSTNIKSLDQFSTLTKAAFL